MFQQFKTWSAVFVLLACSLFSNSQSFFEGFDDIPTSLALPADWFIVNNSTSPDQNWQIGSPTVMPAQAGAPDTYVAAGYFMSSQSSTFGVTLSAWLITPHRIFNNGDQISFYTRQATADFADRLQVRLSTNGTSTNVGTTPTAVGDFTTLLLDVNPTLTPSGFPTTWTQYTITISGLSGPTSGRVAFRYFVTDGGPGGLNSDYIGIDSYEYISTLSASNNDCASATSLTHGQTCVPTQGSVQGASASGVPVTCGGTANNDVWYSFTATSANAIITVDPSALLDPVMEIFDGTCGNLNSIACVDNTLEGEAESIQFTNLVPGNTYFIRVYDWYATAPGTADFDICVEEFTPCNVQQPAGSIPEGETCGADINGGCNMAGSPLFSPINCGDVIWGSAWANNGTRDSDWYSFSVNEPTTVTATVNAEFPAIVAIIDATDCNDLVILSSQVVSTSCTPTTVSHQFTGTGNYVVFVAPSLFEGYPCGTFNNYSLEFDMEVNAPNIAANGPTNVCDGDVVELNSSGNGGFEWLLDGAVIPGANTNQFIAAMSGDYSVHFTDLNGCSDTSNLINVVIDPIDNPSFSFPNFCFGASNGATNIATSGGVFSFDPLPLDGAQINPVNGEISNETLGTAYTIKYVTNGVCPDSSFVTITVQSLDDASFTFTDFCENTTPQVTNIVTPGGSFDFAIPPADGAQIDGASGIITNFTAGTTYEVAYTTPTGTCQASETVQVTVLEAPEVSIVSSGDICLGDVVELTASGADGFVWSNNLGTSAVISDQPNVNTNYEVIGLDNNGCSDTAQVQIIVTPIPSVSAGSDFTACEMEQITLTADNPNGAAIAWDNGVVDGQPFSAPSVATSFVVTADLNSCIATDTVQVNINPAPEVQLLPLDDLCLADPAVTLTVTPTGGNLSGNGVVGNDFNPAVAGVGTHTVTYVYSDANGCEGTAFIDVTVDECLNTVNEDGVQFIWNIFPNPNNGKFVIAFSGEVLVNQIQVVALDGKIVANISVEKIQQEVPIHLDGIVAGVYFIETVIENQILRKRIVVQ